MFSKRFWCTGRSATGALATVGFLVAFGAARARAVEFDTAPPIDGGFGEVSPLTESADVGLTDVPVPAESGVADEVDDGGIVIDRCRTGPDCPAHENRPYGDCPPAPYGMFNRLIDRKNGNGICWTGRADLLLMWRNAPSAQPLVTTAAGATALDAGDVESALAAGPRFSLFRSERCGHAWEATYLRGFNFRGRETLPAAARGYAVAPPGIFGDQEIDLDGASINLGSGIQSFELNRYHKVATNIRLLGGFRWVEWRESATLATVVPAGAIDVYRSDCINSLYGGQLGFEANVLSTRWLRVESLLKGGAYGNTVAANSLLVKPLAGVNETLAFDRSPASCGFVGELGFTGVVPLSSRLDFRFGYFGLWLQGLAQPTRQFLAQDLLDAPPSGTLDTRGGTVVQGVSLGLEGRW